MAAVVDAAGAGVVGGDLVERRLLAAALGGFECREPLLAEDLERAPGARRLDGCSACLRDRFMNSGESGPCWVLEPTALTT